MEKIKHSPLEKAKTVIIAILTVTMLALAALYIGGSQFYTGGAAININEMPSGAVTVGETAPKLAAVYEKELLKASFAGIRFNGEGGGAYACEPASSDLLNFSLEGIHHLLSSSAKISPTTYAEFEKAVNDNRYICISLLSPLPYQIVYALSGEYVAPASYENAISAEALMLVFDGNCNASLYLRDGEKYYISQGEYSVSQGELSVMASDSRLHDFEIANGNPISESSPVVQTLSLGVSALFGHDKLEELLHALEYTGNEVQPLATSSSYNVVAPHGVLLINQDTVTYTAETKGGIPVSSFLGNSKSELDLDMYDILLSTVALAERLCEVFPQSTADLYVDGFYRNDKSYTVVFGGTEGGIPISGDKYPHLVRVTVSGGRFKSIDARLITVEKSGLPFSPFSSAWEYRHAAKNAVIHSLGLRYDVNELPVSELNAAWYYTGERQAEK